MYRIAKEKVNGEVMTYRNEPAWEAYGHAWQAIANPLLAAPSFEESLQLSGYHKKPGLNLGIDLTFCADVYAADQSAQAAEHATYPYLVLVSAKIGNEPDNLCLFAHDFPALLNVLSTLASIVNAMSYQSRGMQNLLAMGEEWKAKREQQYQEFTALFEAKDEGHD